MPGASFQALMADYPGIGTPVSLGSNIVAGAASTVTMTTSAAIPAGSLVVVAVTLNKSSSIAVSSVGDGTANVYTVARTSTWDASNGDVVEIWYCAGVKAVASSATITVTPNVATDAGQQSLVAAAYVPGVTGTPLDKVNSTIYAPNTAYASGSTGTLTQANEIAFGVAAGYTGGSASTTTEGSGFTQVVERQQAGGAQWFIHLAYRKVTATTALNYQPSLSVTSYGASVIATFKAV